MEHFETLEKKVKQAAEQLTVLREENARLKEKLKFTEEDSKDSKILVTDNRSLKDDKKAVSNRIERLLKKINLLNVR